MSGLLSGLSSLGLGDLENADIFEEHKEDDAAKAQGESKAVVVEEKDLVYDKNFACPICDGKITSKVMKTGKAKLLRTDRDLRPVYEGIDAQKYDVISCPKCGFSALSRYFVPMGSGQTKLIKEKICKAVHLKPHTGEIYSYEEALERYKLALACAIVKQGRSSEKGYICLKGAWLLRGWRDSLEDTEENRAERTALVEMEQEYLKNAYEGFNAAKGSEGYPMCGMDEITVDYLLAVLAMGQKDFEMASRLVASILTSPAANVRTKDKTRELKDELLAELKKKKG